MLPENVICPNCSTVLELEPDERETGIVHCEECDCRIDFNSNPLIIKKPKEFVELFTCTNIGDRLLIKSILDDAEVDYYVTGENDAYNMPSKFFIDANRLNDVRELLKDFEHHITSYSTNNEQEDST